MITNGFLIILFLFILFHWVKYALSRKATLTQEQVNLTLLNVLNEEREDHEA
jgi:hypothetical protein